MTILPPQLYGAKRSDESSALYNELEILPCIDLGGGVDRVGDSGHDEHGTDQDGDDLEMLERQSRNEQQVSSQWKALCRMI